MQYQPLLLASLIALSNAAATPSKLALSYGTVSADLFLLSNAIALSGPSPSAIESYEKAISDIEAFQIATGDTEPHPCFPIYITKVTSQEQAQEHINQTEKITTEAFEGAVVQGQPGTEICEATQYLSAVGDYVKGGA